jgi:hypothetical protein
MIPITPATKIADVLAAYPHLEAVLIERAPAFKALKNPILRRTVGRLATVAQAAQVGGVPVRDLVATLRHAAGLPEEECPAETEEASVDLPPTWMDEDKVRMTIDLNRLLEVGEVPLTHVNRALQALAPGEILRLASTFRPAPLLDALHQAGHRTYVTRPSPDTFRTYVQPKPTASV